MPPITRVRGRGFILANQFQRAPRAREDIRVNGLAQREIEHLRQVADNKIAPPDEVAAVRRQLGLAVNEEELAVGESVFLDVPDKTFAGPF